MKKYNIEGSWIIIQYFNVVSNPTDNSIVFIGCEGCGLNEKKNLLNQNVYKVSCLIAAFMDWTFYLEQYKYLKV